MNKFYVARMYKKVLPTIVEEFPYTQKGEQDAFTYAEIMSRTKECEYVVLAITGEPVYNKQ